MVWFAFLYAVLGTWLTFKIGRPLVGLNFAQQRFEADFRFSLVRLRENTESIALYGGEAFADFRARLADYQMERPERLEHSYFAQAEPEELLYDEIEALWAAIAERDDWAPFDAKLAAIERARQAWALA